MKNNKRTPNYSMFLPPNLRKKIDKEVEAGNFSSVAAFIIDSIKKNLKYDKSSDKARKLFVIAGAMIIMAIFIILLAAAIEINISHMIQLRVPA